MVLSAYLQAEGWGKVTRARDKLGVIAQYLVHSKCSINVYWKENCLGISWRLIFANSLPLVLLFSPLFPMKKGRGWCARP